MSAVEDWVSDNVAWVALGGACGALLSLLLALSACRRGRGGEAGQARRALEQRLAAGVAASARHAAGELRRVEATLARRVELLGAERSRQEALRRSLASYLEPLAAAAFELQARCRLLVLADGFLEPTAPESADHAPVAAFYAKRDAQYRETHTLYLIGEYLCCAEIVRREAAELCALDLEDDEEEVDGGMAGDAANAEALSGLAEAPSGKALGAVGGSKDVEAALPGKSSIRGGAQEGAAKRAARARQLARSWRRARREAIVDGLRVLFRLLAEVELSVAGEGIRASGSRCDPSTGAPLPDDGMDGAQWEEGASAPIVQRGDFQLYRGEQRAIAEVMRVAVPLAAGAPGGKGSGASVAAANGATVHAADVGAGAPGIRWQPVGYAEFVERYTARECSAVRGGQAGGALAFGSPGDGGAVHWRVRSGAEEGRWTWSARHGAFRWTPWVAPAEGEQAPPPEVAAAETNAFAAHFRKLHADILRQPGSANAKHRLTRLQRALVRLLDALDPPPAAGASGDKTADVNAAALAYSAAGGQRRRVQRYPKAHTRALVPVLDWRCHAGDCASASTAPHGSSCSFMCEEHTGEPFALVDTPLKQSYRLFGAVADGGGEGDGAGSGAAIQQKGSARASKGKAVRARQSAVARLAAADLAELDSELNRLLEGAQPLLGPTEEELAEAEALVQERIARHVGLNRPVATPSELEGQYGMLVTGEQVPLAIIKEAETARAAMAAELVSRSEREREQLEAIGVPTRTHPKPAAVAALETLIDDESSAVQPLPAPATLEDIEDIEDIEEEEGAGHSAQ